MPFFSSSFQKRGKKKDTKKKTHISRLWFRVLKCLSFFRRGERQKFRRRRHFTAEEDLEEEEEEKDKMLSSRIATQTTTTTTTNGIVATKTKKVRFISICFLSSFAQRFCLVDSLSLRFDEMGCCDVRVVIHRRLSLSTRRGWRRASRIFFSARAGGAGAAMRSSRARFRVLTTSLVLVWSPPLRRTNDAQIASMMNSHVHTHRSNPSNERRKQRRRSLP